MIRDFFEKGYKVMVKQAYGAEEFFIEDFEDDFYEESSFFLDKVDEDKKIAYFIFDFEDWE